jgi:hypothetical protein
MYSLTIAGNTVSSVDTRQPHYQELKAASTRSC